MAKSVTITFDGPLVPNSVLIEFADENPLASFTPDSCCSPPEKVDLKCSEPEPYQTAGLFDRRPLRTFVINRIKERFRGQGYTEAQIDQAIELLEGERPILDWLMNGGFEAILKFIAAILAMFG